MQQSADGQFLIVNSNDRAIRLWRCTDAALRRQRRGQPSSSPSPHSPTLAPAPVFAHEHDHSDVVNRVQWRRSCFSGDGQYVLAGCGERSRHSVYVWARGAEQVATLVSASEGLLDLAHHPHHPFLLCAGTSGRCQLWGKAPVKAQADMSAFAPDFVVLDDNEEYVEQEDEFDHHHHRPAQGTPDQMVDSGGAAEQNIDICGMDSTTSGDEHDLDEENEASLLTLPVDLSALKSTGKDSRIKQPNERGHASVG